MEGGIRSVQVWGRRAGGGPFLRKTRKKLSQEKGEKTGRVEEEASSCRIKGFLQNKKKKKKRKKKKKEKNVLP